MSEHRSCQWHNGVRGGVALPSADMILRTAASRPEVETRSRTPVPVTGACFVLVCLLLLGGCGFAGVPTQSHPACSWTTQPPSNEKTVCQATFSTLSTVVKALSRGDNSTIHRLAPNRVIAARIIAYGNDQRRKGLRFMHVSPSITLQQKSPGNVGAAFYVTGRTRGGKIASLEEVFLQLHGRSGIIVADQPSQEW